MAGPLVEYLSWPDQTRYLSVFDADGVVEEENVALALVSTDSRVLFRAALTAAVLTDGVYCVHVKSGDQPASPVVDMGYVGLRSSDDESVVRRVEHSWTAAHQSLYLTRQAIARTPWSIDAGTDELVVYEDDGVTEHAREPMGSVVSDGTVIDSIGV